MDVSLCIRTKKNCISNHSLPEFARRRGLFWGRHGREAHPCARRFYGTLTLEAAIVLPLVAAFFAVFLFFFHVLRVQTQVQESLYYASRTTACEAGTLDNDAAILALAEVNFKKELSKYEGVNDYVKGTDISVSLLSSDVSDDYVKLRANYSLKIPVGFFSLNAISITQTSESRKWTGDNLGSGTDSVEYVYVTETGTAYHKSRDCTYIKLSIQSVDYSSVASLRNKSGGKYTACSCAEGTTSGTVYITDYGDRYHADLTCSGLKRTVLIIPLSEVGDRTPCSKCAQ